MGVLCKLGRLRIEALAQFGALDTRAKMTAGAHLAVEPAAYCYPLRRIKVFGRSDTASMHRDRTIAETFQQRIDRLCVRRVGRSEEHTSELQSLMRISYAVFCLNKKN